MVFSITVRNTGEKPIASCNVTVYGDSGTATLSLGAINVGQTKSQSATLGGFTATIGNTYLVWIVATAADGSTFDESFTVTCTGSS